MNRISACALASLLSTVWAAATPASSSSPFQAPIGFEDVSQAGRRAMVCHVGQAAVRFTRRAVEIATPQSARPIVATFVNASAGATIEALGEPNSFANYLVGNDPGKWKTRVSRYARLRYPQLYPDINAVFYFDGRDLEYDLDLQPGADLGRFGLRIDGARSISIDATGDLVIDAGRDRLRWRKPHSYQLLSGVKREVESRYVFIGQRTVGIAPGAYDHTQPLTIDPSLAFSTYFGGSGNDAARGIAADGAGNVYISGYTTSMNLPVGPSSLQPAYGGNTANYATGDAFVAKFSPTGALIYVTYLGGSADDIATAIAVDSSGNAYITGFTNSNNFPVTSNAFQKGFAGSGGNQRFRFGDAFVAKLNPSGSALIYSTYLGGSQDELGLGIAVDAAGDAYVTGTTLSSNFPTAGNPFQRSFRGSGGQPQLLEFPFPFFVAGDAFVAELNPSGSGLIFATFLGGTSDDTPLAIAVDATGVYVAGATLSSNFPATPGAFQQTNKGVDARNEFFNFGDAFITKLTPDGSALIYSTYLGGNGDDAITAIAVDGNGSLYATGCTSSSNFPTTNGAYQVNYQGPSAEFTERIQGDAFAIKLNPSGSALVYGTYLGGSSDDGGSSIRVDGAGNAIIAGHTRSNNFPVTPDAMQNRLAGFGGQWNNGDDFGDGFIASLNPAGNTLRYSSYYGGAQDEDITGIAVDNAGNVFATGSTVSTNLPMTAGSFQSSFGGSNSISRLRGDAFVLKVSGLAQNTSAPSIGGIANAASYSAATFAAGEAVVIFGQSLGPAGAPVLAQIDAATGKLSATLAGAQVLFDGVAAPLIYVSAQQSSAIVPFEVASRGSTQVTVLYNGVQSAPFTLRIGTAAPGLFTNNQQGTGQAAIYNQDSTRNSSSNPAAAGSVVVLYGTGAGQFVPAGITGQIVPGSPPFPAIAGPVLVAIGGIAIPPDSILYAGAVPGFVEALFQVNVTLPGDIPSGDRTVVVSIDGVTTQSNVTVAVR